jgi:hypothetical protein
VEDVDLEALRARLTARWAEVGLDGATLAGLPLDATWRTEPRDPADLASGGVAPASPGGGERNFEHTVGRGDLVRVERVVECCEHRAR